MQQLLPLIFRLILIRQFLLHYKYEFSNILSVFQTLTSGLTQVLILIYIPSIINLAIGIFLVTIIQALLTLIIVNKLLGRIYFPKWRFSIVKNLYGFSSYMIGTQIGYICRDYIDKWILNGLKGAVSLPGFTSQTILSRIRSFVSSIFHFIFPMFSSSSQSFDRNKVFSFYDKLQWIVSFWDYFSFCVLSINSFWILNLWISKEFALKYTLILQMACLQGAFSIFSIVPHFSSH